MLPGLTSFNPSYNSLGQTHKVSSYFTDNLGIEEYFEKGGVTIIEWADIIKDYLPEERLDIVFKVIDENTRVLVLRPHGEDYIRVCEDIL